MTYLESLCDLQPTEESYSWKKQYAIKILDAISNDSVDTLDLTLKSIYEKFKIFIDHKKASFYDDDKFNCVLATELGVQTKYIEHFDLIAQLDSSSVFEIKAPNQKWKNNWEKLDFYCPLPPPPPPAMSLTCDESLDDFNDALPSCQPCI